MINIFSLYLEFKKIKKIDPCSKVEAGEFMNKWIKDMFDDIYEIIEKTKTYPISPTAITCKCENIDEHNSIFLNIFMVICDIFYIENKENTNFFKLKYINECINLFFKIFMIIFSESDNATLLRLYHSLYQYREMIKK